MLRTQWYLSPAGIAATPAKIIFFLSSFLLLPPISIKQPLAYSYHHPDLCGPYNRQLDTPNTKASEYMFSLHTRSSDQDNATIAVVVVFAILFVLVGEFGCVGGARRPTATCPLKMSVR